MSAFVLVKVVLELRSPSGIASPEQRHGPDGIHLPLARGPLGQTDADRLYVPASSLAGSLRAHLGDQASVLMGRGPTEEDISASPLRFLGTRVRSNGTVQRSRTAIDRDRGAADTSKLRTGEFLVPGTRITAYLRLDRPNLATELFEALATWSPTVGRGRTSGHGRAVLVELRRRTIDLDTPDGRRAWLTGGGPDLFADEHTEPAPFSTPGESERLLGLRWQVVDGLHVGNGEKKGDPDGPQVALLLRDHLGRPYVPGSTWKGVLRNRCEFVLRSLGAPACAPTDSACGRCLVCRGFGFAGFGQDTPSQRGLLAFDDSAVEGAEIARQAHAPLDRVFGGVTDGLLFTEEVVREGRLTLDVHRAGPVDQTTEERLVALLTLACHDLHHGLVGLGGSTTRGLGTLRLVGDPDDLAAQRTHAVAVLTDALAVTEEAR